jgi:23S rRNA G2445 N2-methylase RlmL
MINAECNAEEGCVTFGFKDFEELCLLCYRLQSADRAAYLIGNFEFRNFFEEFEKFIANTAKSDIGQWIKKGKKFRVECVRSGTHDFNSVDVEQKAAAFILAALKSKEIKADIKNDIKKTDIKNYDITFLVYIVNSICYFGVDFCGFELNKRHYKIFLHPNSLRGTIAYALVRESGFGKKETMLDPFSRDGVIPIEAALFASDFPCNYYKKDRFAFLKLGIGVDFDKFFSKCDKGIKRSKTGIYSYDYSFKYVDYCKKNAKIAGVGKQINFSRVELEWLDIKFKKESVDRIIANPPASKSPNLDKIYNELFYQANYILRNDGTIALVLRMPDIPDLAKKYAVKHNFSLLKEKDVWSGRQLLKIAVFRKA